MARELSKSFSEEEDNDEGEPPKNKKKRATTPIYYDHEKQELVRKKHNTSTEESDDALSYAKLIKFNFRNIVTHHSQLKQNKDQSIIGWDQLHEMTMTDIKNTVRRMLQREEELRLHPLVQMEYNRLSSDAGNSSDKNKGDADDNEARGSTTSNRSRFSVALQASICKEYNLEPLIGLELLESSWHLFPDIACKDPSMHQSILRPRNHYYYNDDD